jgi:hypothetical protein
MRRVLALALIACSPEPRAPEPHAVAPHAVAPHRARGACVDEQIAIERFCVDKYEAYVVELDARGDEHPHSPYDTVEGLRVRAKVAAGVVPQAYISKVQAKAACANAGKRLCTADEYIRACRGTKQFDMYPYGGMQRKPGACNEGKGSFIATAFGADFNKRTYAEFNDPKLNQLEGGLAKTGAFPRCVSPDGAFDMVGNLHEWTEGADMYGHTGFRGGSYGDAETNGPGCFYVTTVHEARYHDYSTGFRCCADAE